MTEQHPITPPPELFKQWEDDILNERDNVDHVLDCAWRHGFQAGADQELEACCAWLSNHNWRSVEPALRAARRPKPPSLAEEALEALEEEDDSMPLMSLQRSDRFELIRRALELLQKLENNG